MTLQEKFGYPSLDMSVDIGEENGMKGWKRDLFGVLASEDDRFSIFGVRDDYELFDGDERILSATGYHFSTELDAQMAAEDRKAATG